MCFQCRSALILSTVCVCLFVCVLMFVRCCVLIENLAKLHLHNYVVTSSSITVSFIKLFQLLDDEIALRCVRLLLGVGGVPFAMEANSAYFVKRYLHELTCCLQYITVLSKHNVAVLATVVPCSH